MYLSHFGLNQAPFGITPNPAFFFAGNKRGAILEALIYAVTHGEGIVKVTGEVGSGKTVLCRMLESMLPENVEVIYLVNPTLSREEVIFTIAGELDLSIGGKRTDEVIRMLHGDLIAKHIAGKQVVLLVEEAQAMPLDTLEEIRLFSNLETAHHKLLQIVLFGQPELDENLNLPRMRQLKERITHSFKVPPLTEQIIPEFLMFRMRAAGYHGPDLFNRRTVKLLSDVSKGVIRRICILADKTLLAAFADNTHSIQVRHVKAAILDSEFSAPPSAIRMRKILTGLLIGSPFLFAGLLFLWMSGWNAAALREKGLPTGSPAPAAAVTTAPVSTAPASTAPVSTAAVSTAAPVTSTTRLAATTTTSLAPSTTVTAPVTTTIATTVATTLPPAIAKPAAATAVGEKAGGVAPTVAAAATADLLQQKLDATKAWLQSETPGHYTVQVALLTPEQRPELERLLKRLQTEIGQEEVHVYPTRIGKAVRFGVMYGNYPVRDQGVVIRTKLSDLGGYQPKLRTIQGLRDEIERTGSKDSWSR